MKCLTTPRVPRGIVSKARRLSACEILEARIAPAAISWTGAVNNDWNTPGNWSGGTVPGMVDDVTINVGIAATVFLSAGTHTVSTLNVTGDDVLNISGGNLTVLSGGSVSNLNLSSGTLTATGGLALTGTST